MQIKEIAQKAKDMTPKQLFSAVIQKTIGKTMITYNIMYADLTKLSYSDHSAVKFRFMTADDTDDLSILVKDYFSSESHHRFKKVPLLRHDPLYKGYMCYDDRDSFVGYCFLMMRGTKYELFRIQKSDAYIAEMYVAQVCRCQGLGTAIVSEVCKELKNQGFQKVSLSVRQDNQSAIRCYTSAGFMQAKKVTVITDYKKTFPYYKI